MMRNTSKLRSTPELKNRKLQNQKITMREKLKRIRDIYGRIAVRR